MYEKSTAQIQALNKAIFLNINHRAKDDQGYAQIQRRMRNGTIDPQDIMSINKRHIHKHNVSLPESSKLRYACPTNLERNAFSTAVFMEHLKKTHSLASNTNATPCPDHTCIIKGTIRPKGRNNHMVSQTLRNMIYDHCGDADVKQSTKKIDPALKFYHNMPLMMNSNERIEEDLANGTPCRGLYVKLRPGATFKPENWEGFMVNTVYAHEVLYILCKYEKDKDDKGPDKYFIIETKSCAVNVHLRTFGIKLKDLNIEQFPVNDNTATTGHKLQGVTLDELVVTRWDYGVPNWVYVVISRLTTSDGLIILELLDDDIERFQCDIKLLQFERNLMQSLEVPLFEQRGEIEEYCTHEDQYA